MGHLADQWADHWEWRDSRGIRWLEDGMIADAGISAQGFSSRAGGVSAAPYAWLNLSYGSGDGADAVRENRCRLGSAIGLWPDRWTALHQVHGTTVLQATQKDAGLGILDPAVALPRADALVTDSPGVALITLHADCIPLFALDPRHRAIGLAHAGWRGTAMNMAGALVAAMARSFGSDPRDLLASVGPGAGGCCYEVDAPVIEPMRERFASMPDAFPAVYRSVPGADRGYLDLRVANAYLLAHSGIPPAQISVSSVCTICNPSFFSHRRKDKGRQAAFLAL